MRKNISRICRVRPSEISTVHQVFLPSRGPGVRFCSTRTGTTRRPSITSPRESSRSTSSFDGASLTLAS